METGKAVAVFLVFAFAYFLSALIRAITATLAPTLVPEFELSARDLGLLAGGYFLGFAATQLPLGKWLDRYGPNRVLLAFLSIAVVGCIAFAQANSFAGLLGARVLCGVGVSACLMAPLTAYRRWYAPATQMRANSWMLMVGSLGMVASTLPVQWLLPLVGWRSIFLMLAAMVVLAMILIAWKVPRWEIQGAVGGISSKSTPVAQSGYAMVWRNAYFRRMAPIGFFNFGGLVAIQTLWAGPWMVKVAGYSALQAATGMFWINVAMLLSFWIWGVANPWLARNGYTPDRLIAYGMPLSFLALAILVIAVKLVSAGAVVVLAWYCMASTVGALAQPAVAMAFPAELAGRALSAFNLVIFCGVFVVQWGIGLMIDWLQALGFAEVTAYQGAFAAFGLCCVGSYVYFLRSKQP
jgi:MFS family permease